MYIKNIRITCEKNFKNLPSYPCFSSILSVDEPLLIRLPSQGREDAVYL